MAESSPSDSAIEPGSLNLNPDSDPSFTAEIDTSTPFVSVREATNRFGGFGFWKPHNTEPVQETTVREGEMTELKTQAAVLQNDLIVKERENDEVLKELEATKATVIELYSKLQQNKKHEEEESLREEEVHCRINPACVVVLNDLNKAKMNLCKRTVDLSGLRRSVAVLSKQLNEEREALEKTRERLMHKSLKVISLEEAKGETSEKDLESNALRMIDEVQRLSCEAREFKRAGEKAMAEIEDTREKIKTVKIRLVAARKIKEAARAAEALAIAEVKAVTDDEEAVTVTISAEEYAELAGCAREAEEEARKRVEAAMSRVEEANVSEKDTLRRAEEAAQEVETSKKALEEAVERTDTARLESEEALRNWKSENGQRRRRSSVNNTAKFKTTTTTRTKSLMDVNGLHLTYDFVLGPSSSSVPVLKPTMSIGEILSKKLLVAEDSDVMNVASQRRKMSLGQMLAKNSNGDGASSKKSEGKENEKRSATSIKRKNLGFAKIVLLLNKEKKNKKIGLNLR